MTQQKPVTGKTVKLAQASQAFNLHPAIVPGLVEDITSLRLMPYKECIKSCRFFYRRDPIASTVVNRIAEITATRLENKRKDAYGNQTVPDEVFEVYNTVIRIIQPYIKTIILSYLIDGMALPQYEMVKVMGNRASDRLGRTRYILPHGLWLRNADNIILKTTFFGGMPRAYLQIPKEDIAFIQNKGVWPDGRKDTQAYVDMLDRYPEYIAIIQDGADTIPFNDYIIFRNLIPGNVYPIPYLEPALDPLNHKRYLKLMDKAIASRAIEAFRHVRVGSDEYPADDDDITATKDALNQKSQVDRVYNLFTNHTVNIDWVIPPLDALLSEGKYTEANADIFFAMGFPRILTVGETEKSNSADNKIASLGIVSTMNHIQKDIIEWIKNLYAQVAVENGFSKVPTPEFSAISLADTAQLIQYARDMVELEVVSRDKIAAFYGTNFETESEQIEYENKKMPREDINANQVTTQTRSPESRMESPSE